MSWDGRRLHSARPRIVNEAAVRGGSGGVTIALRGHFLGVVAESAAAARRAAEQLEIDWRFDTEGRSPAAQTPRDGDAAPDSRGSQLAAVRRETQECARHLDAPDMLGRASLRITHSYGWPTGNHGSPTGNSAPRGDLDWPADAYCRGAAIADVRPGAALIWTAAESTPSLLADLAVLLDLPPERISLAAPPFGATGTHVAVADQSALRHAAADAALLSQIAGRPVQIELRADDLAIGLGAAPHIVNTIDGRVDDRGQMCAYRVDTRLPALLATPLALLLSAAGCAHQASTDPAAPTGTLPPPYEFEHLEVAVGANGTLAAACDPSDRIAAQVFAYESHVDETAAAVQCDPVQWRLRHLRDTRGADLIRRTADRASWVPRDAPLPRAAAAAGGVRHGRGFAYACTLDQGVGPAQHSWSAWVADVEVDTLSGDVAVTRVVVGHDTGEQPMPLANDRDPPPRIMPLHAHAQEAIERLIGERRFDSPLPALRAADSGSRRAGWVGGAGLGAAPIEVVSAVAQPMPLAMGPAAMLPAAAAIANAIYAATGVRLREPPFSPERLRRALDDLRAPRSGRLRAWATPIGAAPIGAARHWVIGALAGLAGALTLLSPWRGSIAPVVPPDPGYFSAAAIERGRLLAAAADCAVCHTAPLGAPYAGGLELATPFGKIISTNITPDADTGIGRWSYAAFERALRSGIHRDGRHLYPAFPYTAYAKLTDGDLLALYAYLMSQPPVHAAAPATRLEFPFNWRPLMAAWNLMFHRANVFMPQPSRSLEWNRGAYLVDALGHCSACHSPRNALGAERRGRDYLAGGVVDGWEAPALNPSSPAPLRWTREDFYDYLRRGYSANHGAAAGPMSAVVTELAALPDADLRAMATYLASLNPAPRPATAVNPLTANAAATHDTNVTAAAASTRASPGGAPAAALDGLGARIYGGACAVCHEPDQGPPVYGVKIALAPTTTLHAAHPTNLIRVLLQGIPNPPYPEIGYMPAFHDTLDDRQLAQLADYLRARFAPGEPPWRNVAQAVASLRSTGGAP
jgi:nicotinate dehydrogenase subunit B